MPAYSFKERFVPFVWNKTKRCTIRGFRKYPVKAGQPAMLYYGMRTKHIRKIWDGDDWPLMHEVKALAFLPGGLIRIFDTNWIEKPDRPAILSGLVIEGIPYHDITGKAERDVFAWNDGFRHSDRPLSTEGCFDIMLKYWSINGGIPFVGFISNW